MSKADHKLDKNYMIGKKYGLLTITKWLDQYHSNSIWQAQCECGKITSVRTCNFNRGKHLSCGCYRNQSPLIRGEHKGDACKLNDEKVILIRHMYYFEMMMRKKNRTGQFKVKYNQTDLAKEFGVDPVCIHKIIKSKTWKHLPNPNILHNKDLRDGRYQFKG